MRRPVRVLVVDDSPTMASALTALLTEDPRIEVVGRAADGQRAVALARLLRPDVITMDLLLPALDGPAAIERIMTEAPTRILVVSSMAGEGADERGASLCFEAMRAGALELIGKPAATGFEDLRRWGRQLAESVCLVSEIPVVTRRPRVGPPLPAAGPARVDVFALVASTGGPPALAEILGRLPGELAAPLLVAQHMQAGFTPGLVRWLDGLTALGLQLAREGERLEPGHVYLPPDGHDLLVGPGGVARLSRSRAGPCPSGDALLESLARVYGWRAGAVVLTGMGEDGARGLLSLRQAGGLTLAQDAASSVVYGMPRAAAELQAAERILALGEVPDCIREACGEAPRKSR
ncbi:response regulator [Aggregicoccus sp. 17bor-14]|uniref:chemotaxis protein CheB n=1 Tax=Myxococcaceae TaxID=31 RepID=UPI0012F256F2|nr:response regulator [Simulacricoccus sp. 17bor-14]MRI87911.1 response regulator [Aggregicoccus sp. 17bor-14]